MNNLLAISSFSHHLICWRTSCTNLTKIMLPSLVTFPQHRLCPLLACRVRDLISGIDIELKSMCDASEISRTYLFCRCHDFCLHNMKSALYDLTIKVITSILMACDMNLRSIHVQPPGVTATNHIYQIFSTPIKTPLSPTNWNNLWTTLSVSVSLFFFSHFLFCRSLHPPSSSANCLPIANVHTLLPLQLLFENFMIHERILLCQVRNTKMCQSWY